MAAAAIATGNPRSAVDATAWTRRKPERGKDPEIGLLPLRLADDRLADEHEAGQCQRHGERTEGVGLVADGIGHGVGLAVPTAEVADRSAGPLRRHRGPDLIDRGAGCEPGEDAGRRRLHGGTPARPPRRSDERRRTHLFDLALGHGQVDGQAGDADEVQRLRRWERLARDRLRLDLDRRPEREPQRPRFVDRQLIDGDRRPALDHQRVAGRRLDRAPVGHRDGALELMALERDGDGHEPGHRGGRHAREAADEGQLLGRLVGPRAQRPLELVGGHVRGTEERRVRGIADTLDEPLVGAVVSAAGRPGGDRQGGDEPGDSSDEEARPPPPPHEPSRPIPNRRHPTILCRPTSGHKGTTSRPPVGLAGAPVRLPTALAGERRRRKRPRPRRSVGGRSLGRSSC